MEKEKVRTKLIIMRKTNNGTLFVLLLLLAVVLQSDLAIAGERRAILDSLVMEVLEKNPELIKARKKSESRGHLVLPSGTLPDPKLGFALANIPTDTFNFDQEPMTSADIFFTQKFPFPGKLSLKEEIADIRSRQSGLSVSELANMLEYRTRRAYFRYYETSKFIDITEDTKRVLKEFLEVARQRYTVGKALQKDLFQAQTAVSNADRKLFELEKAKIEVIAILNTLRSEAVGTHIFLFPDLPVEQISYPEEELLNSAENINPTLARLRLKIEEGNKEVSLARRELYPDFALSGKYRYRDERADFLTGAVTLTLPLYSGSKQREVIKSKSYELMSKEEEYRAYLDRLEFMIRDIMADLESIKKRISLLDSAIIPEARHTVESSLSSYRVGKLEFNSLVTAELGLFRYELELASLKSRYNERKSELWMVVGKDLERDEVKDE